MAELCYEYLFSLQNNCFLCVMNNLCLRIEITKKLYVLPKISLSATINQYVYTAMLQFSSQHTNISFVRF